LYNINLADLSQQKATDFGMMNFTIKKLIEEDFYKNEIEIRYIVYLLDNLMPLLDKSYGGAWYQKELYEFQELKNNLKQYNLKT